jgi:hypothetical protein
MPVVIAATRAVRRSIDLNSLVGQCHVETKKTRLSPPRGLVDRPALIPFIGIG